MGLPLRRIALLVIALLGLSVGTAGAEDGPAGALDQSFSDNGKARLDVGTAPSCSVPNGQACGDSARSIAIDGEGRIVIDGISSTKQGSITGSIVRYLPDGTLDGSFADGGIKSLDTALIPDADLATDSQNRIIAGVFSYADHFSLDTLRLNPDGMDDETFGPDGRVKVQDASAFAVDGSDRVVIAASPSSEGIRIVRYLPDGSLDPALSDSPTVKFDDPLNVDALSVAVGPQGEIVVAGIEYDFDDEEIEKGVLVRFRADGSLDTSFSGDGELRSGYRYDSVTVDSRGRVIASGHNVIDRYLPNGERDRSFSKTGRVHAGTSMVATDARDRLVLASRPVVRLRRDGRLDRTFGENGVPADPNFEHAAAVAIDTDGRIVTAGSTNDKRTSLEDFAVARRFGG